MNRLTRSLAACLLTMTSMTAPVLAITPANGDVSIEEFGPPSYVQERGRTTRPFAHILFCKKLPAECRASGADMVTLTAAAFEELQLINRGVNRHIAPRADIIGQDKWELSPARGDCEDYAITKRHELISRGWPANALRLAMAYTNRGAAHMVLVARTSAGDLVLDNLTGQVLAWDQTGLRLESIQSGNNPQVWASL